MKEDKTLATDINMHDLFASWSNQAGHPFVTVTRDYMTGNVMITQQRDFGRDTRADDTTTFWVPYNYATSKNPNFNETIADGWMNQKTKVLQLGLSTEDRVVFNKQHTSFYRVLYDTANYKLIAKQLNSDNFTVIHALNRYQLLNDLYQFESLDQIPIGVLLDVMSYLGRESEYPAWSIAYRALTRLNEIVPAAQNYEKFQTVAANWTQKLFLSVGIEDLPNEEFLRRNLRYLAIEVACGYGLPECLNATSVKLRNLIQSNVQFLEYSEIHIYNNGVRNATAEDLELLWSRLVESKDMQEQNLLSSSFGFIGNPTLLMKYLLKSLDDYPHIQFAYAWRSNFFQTAYLNDQTKLSVCIEFLKIQSSRIVTLHELENIDYYVEDMSNNVKAERVQKQVLTLFRKLIFN